MAVNIIILGGTGLLGSAFKTFLSQSKDFNLIELDKNSLNLENPQSFEKILDTYDFDILINAGAYTAVDKCEHSKKLAYTVNGYAPGELANICSRRKARMIHFSTDFVFDGQQEKPYSETDIPNPISIYGKSKLLGEQLISDNHLIFRLSWVFGPGRSSFPEWVISNAQKSTRVEIVSDKYACPCYSMAVAEAVVPWLHDSRLTGGIWHYCNPEMVAWSDYAQKILDIADSLNVPLLTKTITPISISQLPQLIATRPKYSALSIDKISNFSKSIPLFWQDALRIHMTNQFKQ